jgi:prepilin-type N-terminal cleavage/methylation domain-containing protein
MTRIHFQSIMNRKGVSLIELLIALVIAAIAVAGIFRLFIAQSKAYTVQDQVAEVQQSIRTSMEVLLRDLRMAGFDNDHINSKVSVPTPLVIGDTNITLAYEYDRTTRYTVAYWRDAGTSRLIRQLTTTKDDGSSVAGPQDVLLDNVEALNFTYGVDEHGSYGYPDGAMDDRNGNGIIDSADWLTTAGVGSRRVVAVQVFLQARPTQVNPDLQAVTPRSLVSAVTLRNLAIVR